MNSSVTDQQKDVQGSFLSWDSRHWTAKQDMVSLPALRSAAAAKKLSHACPTVHLPAGRWPQVAIDNGCML